MRRDPADVLRECAALVSGTGAAVRMYELAILADRGASAETLCNSLQKSVDMPWYYTVDGRAALALAAEDIAL